MGLVIMKMISNVIQFLFSCKKTNWFKGRRECFVICVAFVMRVERPKGEQKGKQAIAGKWGARWERNPSKEERAQCGVAVHPAFEKWWWRQRDWVKILLHLPEEKPLWYIRRQVSLTQWFPLKKYVLKTIAPEGSKMIYNWVIMGTNYLDTWWKDIYNIYY